MPVAHQGVDIDVAEGHLAHEVQPHHHHAGDPEEDDVEAGDQHVAGIVALQLRRLLGPAQGREGPERGGEPGVEHVGVAGQRHRFSVVSLRGGQSLRLGLLHEDPAVRRVPGRNLVPPPELAGDAPGLNVAHPLEVDVFPLLRHEDGAPLLHRVDAGLRQRLGIAEPLVRQPGLAGHAGAVAVRHVVQVVFDGLDQPQRLQVGDDLGARRIAVEAAVGLWCVVVDAGIAVEDVDHLQTVALAHLEVVEVVGRRHLDGAGARLRVRVVVGDDRDPPADQRQQHLLADQVAVAGVFGVHSHAAVAQHRFRPGSRDHDMGAVLPLDRVAEVPELAVDLVLLHFQVRDRGVQLGIPVDQPLVAIDQPFLVEPNEDLADGSRQPFVHREALARPVGGCPQTAELVRDGIAGLRLPLPDLLQELLAAEVVPRHALFGELAFDHHLGGDAGMVRARLPERIACGHAVPAHQHILDGEGQRMPHVQAAGHVRRRHHDGIGLGVGLDVAGEAPGALPAFVLLRLHLARAKGLL